MEVTLPLPDVLVFARANGARVASNRRRSRRAGGRRLGPSDRHPPAGPRVVRSIHRASWRESHYRRFERIDARPRARTAFRADRCRTPPLAGKTLTASCCATSTSTRGELRGGTTFTIDASPDGLSAELTLPSPTSTAFPRLRRPALGAVGKEGASRVRCVVGGGAVAIRRRHWSRGFPRGASCRSPVSLFEHWHKNLF